MRRKQIVICTKGVQKHIIVDGGIYKSLSVPLGRWLA